jgi:hypothetical protein
MTVEDNSVRVKFPPSTYGRLPKELFKDPRTITEGQKIRYIVKKGIDGYRVQEVIPITENLSMDKIKTVLDILDKVKYRDD